MIEFKALSISDAEQVFLMRQDPDVKEMFSGNIFPSSLEMEKEWISSLHKKEPYSVVFGVFYDETFCGQVQFKSIDYISRNCEMAIFIGSSFQGKGIGSSSMDFIIEYAYKTLNMTKIYLKVLEHNEKAIALYVKKGFKICGKLNNHVYKGGSYY
jgi:RimJ/RimL family protein N-acetyltransferase